MSENRLDKGHLIAFRKAVRVDDGVEDQLDASIARHPSGSGGGSENRLKPEVSIGDGASLEHETNVDKLTDEFLHNNANAIVAVAIDADVERRAKGISDLIKLAVSTTLKELER